MVKSIVRNEIFPGRLSLTLKKSIRNKYQICQINQFCCRRLGTSRHSRFLHSSLAFYTPSLKTSSNLVSSDRGLPQIADNDQLSIVQALSSIDLINALQDIVQSLFQMEGWYVYKSRYVQTDKLREERQRKFIQKDPVRNILFRLCAVTSEANASFENEGSDRAFELRNGLVEMANLTQPFLMRLRSEFDSADSVTDSLSLMRYFGQTAFNEGEVSDVVTDILDVLYVCLRSEKRTTRRSEKVFASFLSWLMNRKTFELQFFRVAYPKCHGIKPTMIVLYRHHKIICNSHRSLATGTFVALRYQVIYIRTMTTCNR